MNENNLVPNIRFKGFEAEWEKKKLRKYIKKVSGNDGRINLPTLTISATKGWMNQKERFSRNIAGKEQKNYTLLKKGELSYNHGNSRIFKYGIVYELTNYDEALVPKVYHSFKVNLKASGKFIEYLFRGKKADHELRKLVTSGARLDGLLNISFSNFESIQLYFPKKNEQEKIGDFFSKLDKLLDLQQQKIDKLELLKETLLQKLFPKYGAKIPELRFKGCDGEWEEKKFSSLYKKSNEKNNLSFDSNKIISVANMYYKKDNVKSDDNYMRTYNIFRLGDIAFEGNKSKKFTFGRFVENTIGDGIVSHVFEVFRPISNGDITYWKYAIHNEDFIARILMKSTVKATMMNNLIAKDFLKQRVPVPQLSEQQKIGNLLSKVDQLIELENKKLQNFQQVKKCLLQNMFVD